MVDIQHISPETMIIHNGNDARTFPELNKNIVYLNNWVLINIIAFLILAKRKVHKLLTEQKMKIDIFKNNATKLTVIRIAV